MPALAPRTILTRSAAVAAAAGVLVLLPGVAGAAPGGGAASASSSPTTSAAPATSAAPTTVKARSTTTVVKPSTTVAASSGATKQYSPPTSSASTSRTGTGASGTGSSTGSATGSTGSTTRSSAAAGSAGAASGAGSQAGKGSATSTTLDPGTEALPEGAPATPALLIGGDPNRTPSGSTGKLLGPITKLWLIGAGFLFAGLVALVLTVRYARRTKPTAATSPARGRHHARSGAGRSSTTRSSHRGAHGRRAPARSGRPAPRTTRPAASRAAVSTGDVVASRWRQGEQSGPRRQPMPSLAGPRDDTLDRTLEERVPTML